MAVGTIGAIRFIGFFALWQFRHFSYVRPIIGRPPRGREFSSREAVLPLTYLVREDGLHTLKRLAVATHQPDQRAAKRNWQLVIL